MKRSLKRLAALIAPFLLCGAAGLFAGCDHAHIQWSFSFESDSGGELRVLITDTPTDDYRAVYVTIDEVRVQGPKEQWQTVSTPHKTYNLLELADGVREQLGLKDLAAGDYTQVRLLLGAKPGAGFNLLGDPHPYANYLIDPANHCELLKVPSGFQSGIQVVHGFKVREGKSTEIVLDFDALKSIIQAGGSGTWLLKPAVTFLEVESDRPVTGVVQDAMGYPLAGARLSAQVYDPSMEDPKDVVSAAASTLTNAQGCYTLFLPPGSFLLVAQSDGLHAGFREIGAGAQGPLTEDFLLDPALMGSAQGQVVVPGAPADQHVTLSFRKTVQGEGGEPVQIEVRFLHVANFAPFAINLPAGSYCVAASTEARSTKVYEITVWEGAASVLNVQL